MDRKETPLAWKVTIEQIRAGGYNLDIANPNAPRQQHKDPDMLLAEFDRERAAAAALREELREALADALLSERG
jgi:type I restriction enzyme M protein